MSDVLGKMTISGGEITYPAEMGNEKEVQVIETPQPVIIQSEPEPVEEVVAPAPQVRAEPTAEEKAELQGWMPKDRYVQKKGTEEGWKPADEFNKKVEDNYFLLKSRYEKLERDRLADKQEFAQVKTLLEKQFEAGKKAAMEELNKKQFDAIQQGDHAAWDRIEKEKSNLQQAKPEIATPQPQPAQQIPPELIQWRAENPWFGADIEMTQEALRLSEQINAESPWAAPAAIAAQVEKQIKQKYARKFGLPDGSAPTQHVARGQGAVQQSAKTYSISDLRPEDAALANKYKKYGFPTREAYIKEILKGY
jgi:hypothetical protein